MELKKFFQPCRETTVNVTAFTIIDILVPEWPQRQSRLEHSPVTINLIHASGAILTPMLNTIIDIYAAVLTGPTRCTDTCVATGIVQNTASSIGTWLLIEKRRCICYEMRLLMC